MCERELPAGRGEAEEVDAHELLLGRSEVKEDRGLGWGQMDEDG